MLCGLRFAARAAGACRARLPGATSLVRTSPCGADLPEDDRLRIVKDLESQRKVASKNLEFEKAALLRDQMVDLRKVIAEELLTSGI